MQKLFLILSSVAMLTVLSACETADDNSIESARACVSAAARLVSTNSAAAISKATECNTLVTNMTSPESGKIGFAAILIIEGKYTQLPNMASSIQSGTNSLGNGMAFLVFTSNVSNPNYTKILEYANRSGSAGIRKIANMITVANISDSLGAVGGSGATLETNIQGMTPSNANTPGTQEYQVVQAVVSMQQDSCSGSGSTSSLCSQLTQAIGAGGSNSAIMTSIQAYLAAN